MSPYRRLAGAGALLLALLCSHSLGDPMVSWPGLDAQAGRRGGLFAAWSIDQKKVAASLRALGNGQDDGDVAELQRRAADDPTDLAAADALAVRYWRKGRFHEAVELLRRILDLAPTFSRSRLNLADLFEDLGSRELAIQEVAAGVRAEPSSARLHRRLAELHSAEGDFRRAAEALMEVRKLAPDDPHVTLRLAREWTLAGDDAAAKDVLAALPRPAPAGSDLLLAWADAHRAVGALGPAREAWEDLRKRRSSGAASVQLGLLALHQGNPAESRKRFEDALASDGDTPLALLGAGVAALGLGEHDAVIGLCGRLRAAGGARLAAGLLANMWLARGDATALDAVWAGVPGGGERMRDGYAQLLALTRADDGARKELGSMLGRVEALREAGWLRQTIEPLDGARARFRASSLLGATLAACYAATGRLDQELTVREELAKERPDDPVACQEAVRALVARRQWTRAEELSRAFCKHMGTDLESHVAAASIALRNGDYEAAVADCQPVLGRHALDGRPYGLLLDALVRSGKLSDAATAVRGRQGAVRTFAPGPLERAILSAVDGRADDALAEVRRGLRRSPTDHRLWLLGGSLLDAKGDVGSALAHFQVAAWLQPEHVSTRMILARAATRGGATAVAAEAYRSARALSPDTFELGMEFADALVLWARHEEAGKVLDSLRPAPGAQRDAVDGRRADLHLARGDVARALELAQAILAKDPGEPKAAEVALAACRKQGDLAAGIKLCEAAAKARGGAATAAELGLVCLIEQRYAEAAEQCGEAARRSKEGAARSDARRLQAIALLGQGLAPKAQAAVQEALGGRAADAAPTEDLVVTLAAVGLEAKARELLARLEKENPTRAGWLRRLLPRLASDRELACRVATAHVASGAGWHSRAAELFAATAKQANDEPILLYEGASSRLRAGELDAAAARAHELAASCPNVPDVHLLLASVLEKQGKADAALASYTRALGMLDKQAVTQRLAIAERLGAAGKVDGAIEAFRSVVDAQPSNRVACQKLASLYAAHKPDRLAEAEKLATAAAKAAPDNAACRDTLGWIHFLNKRTDAARAEILAAIALEPRSATCFYHLGMVEFVAGRGARAQRALRIALTLDPKLPEAETARSTLKAIDARKPPGEPLAP